MYLSHGQASERMPVENRLIFTQMKERMHQRRGVLTAAAEQVMREAQRDAGPGGKKRGKAAVPSGSESIMKRGAQL